jgi:hypothetical protein
MHERILDENQQKALEEFKAIRKALRVPFPEDMRDLVTRESHNPEFPEERRWKGPCLGYSYSLVRILKPKDRSVFSQRDLNIEFEGQVTRSSETNWEDKSDELEWKSSLINKNLGKGRKIVANLPSGPQMHVITASWQGRKDSIVIYVEGSDIIIK